MYLQYLPISTNPWIAEARIASDDVAVEEVQMGLVGARSLQCRVVQDGVRCLARPSTVWRLDKISVLPCTPVCYAVP